MENQDSNIKTYLGNPLLRRSGVVYEYTEEQIEEITRCANDSLYFIENYVKIVNVDEGLVQFQPWEYQKNMINTFTYNRFVICKLPRQSGKSTCVTSYMLWLILFHSNQNIAILANKGQLARDLLEKIRIAYENLPKWIQQGVTVWNKGSIGLENGSKIIAAATSSSAVRGGSYNLIFLDEFAFVGNNMAEDFFKSVYPTITSGKTTKVIIVSTPNGMNHFYKMWTDATEKRSTYVPLEFHWSDVPGRDEKWKEETISNTSQEQFDQEFECMFLGGNNTLISGRKLRQLAWKTPHDSKNGLDIHNDPEYGHVYTITVDVAHGGGLDYSAFSVIDVTDFPYKQVAKFYDNKTPIMLYSDIIYNVAKKYNNALILIEINESGQQLADTIYSDLEYENVIHVMAKGRKGQIVSFSSKASPGVKMSKQVKALGCANLKDFVELDKLIIQDFETISELSSFVAKGTSFEADDGHNDDLVMSLVLFGWLAKQQYFRELVNADTREQIIKDLEKKYEEEVLPFGEILDGSEEIYDAWNGNISENQDINDVFPEQVILWD